MSMLKGEDLDWQNFRQRSSCRNQMQTVYHDASLPSLVLSFPPHTAPWFLPFSCSSLCRCWPLSSHSLQGRPLPTLQGPLQGDPPWPPCQKAAHSFAGLPCLSTVSSTVTITSWKHSCVCVYLVISCLCLSTANSLMDPVLHPS